MLNDFKLYESAKLSEALEAVNSTRDMTSPQEALLVLPSYVRIKICISTALKTRFTIREREKETSDVAAWPNFSATLSQKY